MKRLIVTIIGTSIVTNIIVGVAVALGACPLYASLLALLSFWALWDAVEDAYDLCTAWLSHRRWVGKMNRAYASV